MCLQSIHSTKKSNQEYGFKLFFYRKGNYHSFYMNDNFKEQVEYTAEKKCLHNFLTSTNSISYKYGFHFYKDLNAIKSAYNFFIISTAPAPKDSYLCICRVKMRNVHTKGIEAESDIVHVASNMTILKRLDF